MPSDVQMFLQWLTAGWPPDCCLELRILPRRGGPLVGFFTPDAAGLTAAARVAAHWGGGLGQTYVGLNPRHSRLLDVAHNRLTRTSRAGREEDIAAVTTILIDLDPRRPKGTASTDAELAAARGVARAIDRWWRDQGWAPPLVVMSGNGYHAWGRVPPQDPGTFPAYLRAFLADIAGRFGVPGVDIDLAVADAPRIGKVPGSISVKGSNSVERPWRRATIAAWAPPVPDARLAAHILSLPPMRHYQRGGGAPAAETARRDREGSGAGQPTGQPLKPRALLDRALARCLFLRWCRDNPAAVREPGWYSVATNLAIFEGGEEAFYRLSEGYPGYDPREAERKFWHAVKSAPGPNTCQHLTDVGDLGFACPLLGVCPVRAPAALGYVSDREWAAVQNLAALAANEPGAILEAVSELQARRLAATCARQRKPGWRGDAV